MAELIYLALTSLDGYIEDRDGNFDWAAPDEEVHRFINELQRPARTYLYGRRMYETMMVWETDPRLADDSPVTGEFASLWQATEKIVYSRALEVAPTARTRIERTFDPQAVRYLKETGDGDFFIGGAELAGEAFRAGLVDQCQFFLAPIAVGGGKPALPTDLCLPLELLEERRFASGMVYLRYRVRSG